MKDTEKEIECIIKKVLEKLTRKLSLGSKFVKFSTEDDIEMTRELFTKLKHNGIPFNSELICTWADDNDKWRENEIGLLFDIAESVKGNKHIALTNHYKEDIIDKIREKCND